MRMVANAICELDVAKPTGPDYIPSIVPKMCSPELSPVLSKLYNKCLFEACFHIVGNFPLLYLLTKMMLRDLILVTIAPSAFFESFVNDRISKYIEGAGLFLDLQYGFRTFRPLLIYWRS